MNVKIIDGFVVEMPKVATEKVKITAFRDRADSFQRVAPGQKESPHQYQVAHATNPIYPTISEALNTKIGYSHNQYAIHFYCSEKVSDPAATKNLDKAGYVPSELVGKFWERTWDIDWFPLIVDKLPDLVGTPVLKSPAFAPAGYSDAHKAQAISFVQSLLSAKISPAVYLIPHIAGTSIYNSPTAKSTLETKAALTKFESLKKTLDPKHIYTACALIIVLNELACFAQKDPDTSLLDMLKDESFKAKMKKRCQSLHFEVYPHSFSLLFALNSADILCNTSKLKTLKARNALANITARGIMSITRATDRLQAYYVNGNAPSAEKLETLCDSMPQLDAFLVSEKTREKENPAELLPSWVRSANTGKIPRREERATGENIGYIFSIAHTIGMSRLLREHNGIPGGKEMLVKAAKLRTLDNLCYSSKARAELIADTINAVGVCFFKEHAPLSVLWALSEFTLRASHGLNTSFGIEEITALAEKVTRFVQDEEEKSAKKLDFIASVIFDFPAVEIPAHVFDVPEASQAYAQGMSLEMVFNMVGIIRDERDWRKQIVSDAKNLRAHGF